MGVEAQRAQSCPTSSRRNRNEPQGSQSAIAKKSHSDVDLNKPLPRPPGNWRIKSRAGTLVVPLINRTNSDPSWTIETDYEYQLMEPWLTIFSGKIASRPECSVLSSPLEAASPAGFFFVSDEEIMELEKYRKRVSWEYGLAIELEKYAKECQEAKKEEYRLCDWRLRLAKDFDRREAKEPRKVNQLSELGRNIKRFINGDTEVDVESAVNHFVTEARKEDEGGAKKQSAQAEGKREERMARIKQTRAYLGAEIDQLYTFDDESDVDRNEDIYRLAAAEEQLNAVRGLHERLHS